MFYLLVWSERDNPKGTGRIILKFGKRIGSKSAPR